jgi:hypothetical protein
MVTIATNWTDLGIALLTFLPFMLLIVYSTRKLDTNDKKKRLRKTKKK